MLEHLQSTRILSDFIQTNKIALSDCFHTINHSELVEYSDELAQGLIINSSKVNELDFSNTVNQEFIILCLLMAVRLNDGFLFQQYSSIASQNGISLPKVLLSASSYMVGFDDFTQEEQVLNNVFDILSLAFLEEDNQDFILLIISNYLSIASLNFRFSVDNYGRTQSRVRRLIDLHLPFLRDNELITKLLSLTPEWGVDLSPSIKELIDVYFSRTGTVLDFELEDFLVENSGAYFDDFSHSSISSFSDIRDLSVTAYNRLGDDTIYKTLGRGVSILDDEKQLFGYLYSFGKMHMQKIESCCEFIDFSFFDNDCSIIDWGCGQGIGSFILLSRIEDYLSNVEKVVLIEPSTLAIKRAALHVSNYTSNYLTINKVFDDLELTDFKISTDSNFHIFSNILDVTFFSLEQFIELFKLRFRGLNYILIVSPQLNISRLNRIESFISEITKGTDVVMEYSVSEGAYEWIPTKQWTREIRLFKVNIH